MAMVATPAAKGFGGKAINGFVDKPPATPLWLYIGPPFSFLPHIIIEVCF
jgi:hypothetical protein